MSVARNLLDDLAVIGATIKPAGDRLILRAGRTAIPAALVSRVRAGKGRSPGNTRGRCGPLQSLER